MVSPNDGHVYDTTASAVDSQRHSNFAVSSIDESDLPLGAFFSTNAGLTWSSNPPPLPASPPNDFAAEPAMAFDASGNLYSAELGVAVTETAVSSQLVVSPSANHGTTWGTPAVVDTVLPDKPLLAVDLTNGRSASHPNRVYVGYNINPNGPSQPLMVAHSDDGRSWLRTQVWDSGGDFGAAPVVGPNGEVYVAWDDYCGGVTPAITCVDPAGKIVIAKSTDGGSTFRALGSAPVAIAATSIGFGTTIPRFGSPCFQGGRQPTVQPAPAIDVDRSGGPRTGNLYAVWADQQPGSRMHAYFARSLDGGLTWSRAIGLDTGNAFDAWQPALAVDQTDGVVTVAWYDRRGDYANQLYRVYYTQSTDGGVTFLPSQLAVSSSQSDPGLNCLGTGGYMQMVAVDGSAHPFWIDTRNGINQVFTADIDEAAVATSATPARSPFGTPSSQALGGAPPTNLAMKTLAVGDFNNDGHPDLALTRTAPPGFIVQHGNVSILLGAAGGGFASPVTYDLTVGAGSVRNVLASDFNGDGKLDLAVDGEACNPSCASTIWILKGVGDGTFQGAATISAGTSGMAAGDLNGDGKPDLILGSGSDPGSMAVVLNSSSAGAFAFRPPAALGVDGAIPVVADFNHDGKPDIAFANGSNGVVGIVLGHGDATFSAPALYPVGGFPAALVAGDLNGDGKSDLVAGGSNGVDALIGQGDGTFSVNLVQSFDYGGWGTPLALGDFTSDGIPDLVVGGAVLLGNGNGSFKRGITITTYGISPYSAAVADLNGDGRSDLVYSGGTYPDGTPGFAVYPAAGPRLLASVRELRLTSPAYGVAGPAQVITFTNPGTESTTIALVRTTSYEFLKTADSCSGIALLVGSSCQVTLRFKPTTGPVKAASLLVVSDAPGTPQVVRLIGERVRAQPAGPAPGTPHSRPGPPPPVVTSRPQTR